MNSVKQQLESEQTGHSFAMLKFIIFSGLGIISFFVPITINGESSILLDHIVSVIKGMNPLIINTYILLILFTGALYPFIKKTWNDSAVQITLSFFKIAGFLFGFMLIFKTGPDWLFYPDLGPFLLEKLIIPVGILIPIGAMFLALLVSYGFLEFVGVFMQSVMRPLFRTPGRSAIDAVASFVGSYSIGLLVTNRVFNQGKYTYREATIIATGFSTVSVTFMIVIANTLNLMEYWNLYFWTSLIVTFFVTAITVRIWPLNNIENTYCTGEGDPEVVIRNNKLHHAWKEGMKAADESAPFFTNIFSHFREGLIMTMNTLPSIMSVGLLGLVLAYYTPLFDWMAYLFLPVTWLLQAPEALLTAKAAAISISEIFLPSLIVTEADLVTRFIVAVLSVSSIIFFSAVVPVILSTDIPISIFKMVIIWFERVFITLLIIIPISILLF
ncbi:YjiH family protein [Pontibacillus litoralis]|uniref:Histidine transporter n=1 Tax=Pontibacillus litoralis JSM 072002 TaxID=1385512 RepID=A0A0A5G4F8_9BACI|nr:YjiH family protein [Pontibacillus litoralis]KGX86003.1 histidine transporter [Pontibacillus litoralis JSM 072002]